MKVDKKGIRVEFMPLGEVLPADNNPKDHDIGELIESINRFGFVAPGLIDESSGKLVAGHGRRDALEVMRADGRPVPEGVKTEKGDNGAWLMPVVRGITFESPSEAEAYLLADNRLTEIGGWTEHQLLASLQSITAADGEAALRGIGFDADDMAELFEKLNDEESDWPELPDGERNDIRQMTFTVTEAQQAVVNDALAAGLKTGECDPEITGNTNANGNALSVVCETFLKTQDDYAG